MKPHHWFKQGTCVKCGACAAAWYQSGSSCPTPNTPEQLAAEAKTRARYDRQIDLAIQRKKMAP